MWGRFALHSRHEKPIYFPRQHPIVTQLILGAHENCGRFGKTYALTEFREKFWIEKSRSYVMKTLKVQCYKCRRPNSIKFALPAMDPLPENRVIVMNAVFQNTALDYAGIFHIKTNDSNVRKKWMCIFTCLFTKALHLKTVRDLLTTGFKLASQRFMARREKPETLLSDNGIQFAAVSKLLNTKWEFITPSKILKRIDF